MQLVLIVLGLTYMFELGLYLPALWRHRRLLAVVAIGLIAVSTCLFLLKNYSLWLVGWAFLALYRVINMGRLVENRLQTDYLHRETWRSSLWLIYGQLILLALGLLSAHTAVNPAYYWYTLVAGQLAMALITSLAYRQRIKTSQPPKIIQNLADKDLPGLSVAIPARNETDDLENCLQSLLASNYPKLEILVLDDCSQNKHTPEIIRSFAHAGVRFIAGQVPPEQWTAKNFAYKQLAEEANGEIILFCGVDLRVEANSLRQLVEIMRQTDKTMLSVMPRNLLPTKAGWRALLTQPDRYLWEIALPRTKKRPPVLSTCWLINSVQLAKSGGLQAVTRKNSPESYFARLAAAINSYSFIVSDENIGLSCAKRLDEQIATATRSRYPQLHRRPELVAALSLAELLLLFMPLPLFVISPTSGHWLLAAISGLAWLLQITIYVRTVALTYRQFVWRSLILFPLAVLYDIGLLNYSMWRYEFSQVLWKGRNVCLPLVKAYSSLPKQ